jgi:dihydroorotase
MVRAETVRDDAGGDLRIRGGLVVRPTSAEIADVRIRGGRIEAVGAALPPRDGEVIVEAAGMWVFPGLIDPQVHFREPGLEHKEDLASGSLAAIAGGVTAFMEMPNTKPATTDPARLADKLARAAGRAHADHAFFLGATHDNADRLGEWERSPGCAGVKVFLGSSTGDLLVPDDPTLERVLRSGSRRVAVHSEDEPRLRERYAALEPGVSVLRHPEVRDVECAVRATRRLLDLVERTGRRVHLLHVSTAEEIELLRSRGLGDLVTCEVTPNHLFLAAPDCYERYGTLAQMNPPVRDAPHRDAIWQGVLDGVVDVLGSDHAPHTLEEKGRPYPDSPSGIPGVQTILPLLLTAVRDGWLRKEDVPRICTAGPIRVYGLEGKGCLEVGTDGDAVIVDPARRGPLRLERLHSHAGYSPYVGNALAGDVTTTILRGRIAWHDGIPAPPSGRPLRFVSNSPLK